VQPIEIQNSQIHNKYTFRARISPGSACSATLVVTNSIGGCNALHLAPGPSRPAQDPWSAHLLRRSNADILVTCAAYVGCTCEFRVGPAKCVVSNQSVANRACRLHTKQISSKSMRSFRPQGPRTSKKRRTTGSVAHVTVSHIFDLPICDGKSYVHFECQMCLRLFKTPGTTTLALQ
jgi:hypothetical protein